MKRIITLILCMVMILALCCACGTKDEPSSAASESSTEELRKITVALDSYPKADTVFLYMAQEQGFFAEEGLYVDFVMPSELSPAEMVSQGYSYFGMCSQPDVISARCAGHSIKSIGTVLQSPQDLFLTKKGNKIYSPSDLYDKKFGYDGSELQKAMIACMLYGSYRSFMDIDLVDISGMDLGEILESGTVDAMAAGSILYDLPLLEEKNLEPDWLKLENYNIPSYYGEVLVASDALIESEPDLIRAFLRACSKGYEAMKSDKEEAIRCLVRSQDKENLPVSDSLARTTLYTVIPMMKPDEVSFLEQSPERWDKLVQWMSEWKLIPADTVSQDMFAVLS